MRTDRHQTNHPLDHHHNHEHHNHDNYRSAPTDACTTNLPQTTTSHDWTTDCEAEHRTSTNETLYAKRYTIRDVTPGKIKIEVSSSVAFVLTWAELSSAGTVGTTTDLASQASTVHGNLVEWNPPGRTSGSVNYRIEISRTSTTTTNLGSHTIKTSLLLAQPPE